MIPVKIKFGTDGWRAIMGKEYTLENLSRIAKATADWVLTFGDEKKVVLGHDCRLNGSQYVKRIAEVMINSGVDVVVAPDYVTTPIISLATKELNADIGVIVTASHNPADYSGYKLKGKFGGPLQEDDLDWIENNIPEFYDEDLIRLSLDDGFNSGKVEELDMEQIYIDKVKSNFDLDLIRSVSSKFAYNAMYGSGQGVVTKLLPEIVKFNCQLDPTFGGISPEPIPKNLVDFQCALQEGDFSSALVNDGDADRLAMYDEKGNYIDSHHLMLILLHYLCKHQGMKGKVVTGVSTTPRLERLAKHYGLDFEYVKIGFKHACGVMLKDDVLLAGEESGGMALKGHIPERDGVWNGLMIWEFMARSGKSMQEIIDEVYEIIGPFHYIREDLKVSVEKKEEVVQRCKNDEFSSFGKYEVSEVITIDGYKYIFNDDEWLMIRPSGTEPVLRLYAEGKDKAGAEEILREAKIQLALFR